MTKLTQLQERLARTRGPDNSVDIEIDVALFEPDEHHSAVRANSAGTKLVYAKRGGGTDTFWARDWTLTQASRNEAAALLAALPLLSRKGPR